MGQVVDMKQFSKQRSQQWKTNVNLEQATTLAQRIRRLERMIEDVDASLPTLPTVIEHESAAIRSLELRFELNRVREQHQKVWNKR